MLQGHAAEGFVEGSKSVLLFLGPFVLVTCVPPLPTRDRIPADYQHPRLSRTLTPLHVRVAEEGILLLPVAVEPDVRSQQLR